MQYTIDEFFLGYGILPLLLTFSGVISYSDESCLLSVVRQLTPNIRPSDVITVLAFYVKVQFIDNYLYTAYYF